jgi:hypothetical protein
MVAGAVIVVVLFGLLFYIRALLPIDSLKVCAGPLPLGQVFDENEGFVGWCWLVQPLLRRHLRAHLAHKLCRSVVTGNMGHCDERLSPRAMC